MKHFKTSLILIGILSYFILPFVFKSLLIQCIIYMLPFMTLLYILIYINLKDKM